MSALVALIPGRRLRNEPPHPFANPPPFPPFSAWDRFTGCRQML
jgi:hypothetical protein